MDDILREVEQVANTTGPRLYAVSIVGVRTRSTGWTMTSAASYVYDSDLNAARARFRRQFAEQYPQHEDIYIYFEEIPADLLRHVVAELPPDA